MRGGEMSASSDEVVGGVTPGVQLGHANEGRGGILVAAKGELCPGELEDKECVSLLEGVLVAWCETCFEGGDSSVGLACHALDFGMV